MYVVFGDSPATKAACTNSPISVSPEDLTVIFNKLLASIGHTLAVATNEETAR